MINLEIRTAAKLNTQLADLLVFDVIYKRENETTVSNLLFLLLFLYVSKSCQW
jgi:hypothetical protein